MNSSAEEENKRKAEDSTTIITNDDDGDNNNSSKKAWCNTNNTTTTTNTTNNNNKRSKWCTTTPLPPLPTTTTKSLSLEEQATGPRVKFTVNYISGIRAPLETEWKPLSIALQTSEELGAAPVCPREGFVFGNGAVLVVCEEEENNDNDDDDKNHHNPNQQQEEDDDHSNPGRSSSSNRRRSSKKFSVVVSKSGRLAGTSYTQSQFVRLLNFDNDTWTATYGGCVLEEEEDEEEDNNKSSKSSNNSSSKSSVVTANEETNEELVEQDNKPPESAAGNTTTTNSSNIDTTTTIANDNNKIKLLIPPPTTRTKSLQKQPPTIKPSSDTPLLWNALMVAPKQCQWKLQPKFVLHGHSCSSEEEAYDKGFPCSAKETLFSTPADLEALMILFQQYSYPEHKVFVRKNHGFFLLAQDHKEACQIFREQLVPTIPKVLVEEQANNNV